MTKPSLLALLLLASCGGGGGDPPANDAGATCSIGSPFEEGDPKGAPDPIAAPGQARAGVLSKAQLPTDRTGLATFREGNFVLSNGKIAVLIEQAGTSSRYDPWGGKPVGLARVEGGKLVDAADFDELFFSVGRYTVETQRVTVLRDGRAGGSASIRAVGVLRPLPFIAEFGKVLAPDDYPEVKVALDYELAPDAEHVDVSMTFDNDQTEALPVPSPLAGFFQAYRMPRFLAGAGFASKLPSGARYPYVGFVDENGASYAFKAPDGATLAPFISVIGFDTFKADPFEMPACSRTRRAVAKLVVGGKGADGLVRAIARVDGVALRTIKGKVEAPAGERARVHATSPDGAQYYTRANVKEDGSYELAVPANVDVSLRAYVAGANLSPAVTVAKGATDAPTISVPTSGTVHVVAKDAANAPLPVRVQVLAQEGTAPAPPPSFGEPRPQGGQLWVAFPKNGDVTLRVPPGKHRVIVSRGYEYDVVDREVEVAADGAVTVDAKLERVVDSAGLLCADFHVHSHRSPDSPDDVRLTVSALAGEGVEIAARTEHEFIADFEPTIAELGLGNHLFGLGSIELTTFEWGHFGVFPLVPDPTKPNAGAFFWPGKKPPQVFAEVRAVASKPTIIINHPRSGGGGGYFSTALLDANTGLARKEDMWDEGFKLIEVFNGSDFEANRKGSVRDWFALLKRGKRVFAVSGSDCHYSDGTGPHGYPRTCIALGDAPRSLTGALVRDAVDAGRSTISGGILVTTKVGTTTEGGTAAGVGPKAKVRVRVQAPLWVDVGSLEVLVDGNTVATLPIDASTRDPSNPVVRFDRDVEVDVAPGGSFVVAVARGTKDLAPVHPGNTPFGVTNPIFLAR